MIVVKVELHSAITGAISNLGTVIIHNVGGTKNKGNYSAVSFKRGHDPVAANSLRKNKVRDGRVEGHNRLSEPVLNLVSKALRSMGYE